MSTELTWRIASTSSDDTERIAEAIGVKLRGGEVIELVSDLGGGKTTFVRGLARGLGSSDKVASPSFTISREYSIKKTSNGVEKLVHFDFYRLNDPGLVANELAEIIGDTRTVVVVEWAGIVENVLPTNRLRINFKNVGENKRELTFHCPNKLEYLK